MALSIVDSSISLKADADGVVRVSSTRVTLDTVVAAFDNGATAEEIVQRYPVVELSDVYVVIGYYLRNREAVDAYLAQRRNQAERLRELSAPATSATDIRHRLLARRAPATN
jgi:uncharacterized protein (DUF433 family)